MSLYIHFIVWSIIIIAHTTASTNTQSSTTMSDEPNIKIVSNEIHCEQSKNICIAKGNAKAEKLKDSKVKVLKADQITAHFTKKDSKGPLKVTHLEAEGNVFLIIGDIIVQGRHGQYSDETEIAEVFDDVKITNGKNQLDGGYARVNMKTGHYTIKRDGERVTALIFTKDKKEVS